MGLLQRQKETTRSRHRASAKQGACVKDGSSVVADALPSDSSKVKKLRTWKLCANRRNSQHINIALMGLTILLIFSIAAFDGSPLIGGVVGTSYGGFYSRPLVVRLVGTGTVRHAERLTLSGDRTGTGNLKFTSYHRGQPRQVYVAVHGSIDDYEDHHAAKYDPKMEGCAPLADWQSKSYPTCNLQHEFSVAQDEEAAIVGEGTYREVWNVKDMTERPTGFKTLRFEQDYMGYDFRRHLERHAVDAMAMERLTPSPYVVDIYSFCGNGGIFEFASGGSLSTYRKAEKHSPSENLRATLDAARGIADFHSIDSKPSIVHNDIKVNQFILVDGKFKFNDFNKAKYLIYNKETDEVCPNKNAITSNAKAFHSPEEYRGDRLTEKVDVYSLGNIIFTVLARKYPFKGVEHADARKMIMAGTRPTLPDDILNSKDPRNEVLVKAMQLCHKQDPSERPTAREIAYMLEDAVNKYG